MLHCNRGAVKERPWLVIQGMLMTDGHRSRGPGAVGGRVSDSSCPIPGVLWEGVCSSKTAMPVDAHQGDSSGADVDRMLFR